MDPRDDDDARGEREHATTSTSIQQPAPAQPQLAPTQPQLAPTQPQSAPTQPQLAPTQPQLAPTQPQWAPTQPQLAPTPPQLAPTQPHLALAQPSPTSTGQPQISIPVRSVRSAERLPEEDTYYSPSTRDNGRYANPLPPLPVLSGNGNPIEVRPPIRTRTIDTHHSGRPPSRLDWIVPVEEKAIIPKMSIGERLQPTLAMAHIERDKYAVKAKMTGYALNAAIGLQVLLGSLTTGLAAATTAGKQAAIATTVLGGLSTLVASYLARARGSNEPELSITRVKDLEQYIREADAFHMDYGHITTDEQDHRLFRFRERFEELLGNASGERKLAPPA